ncbi:flagellin [Litorivicinus sp.]|nr:flagellin [Litorivicinus sp.]
MSIVIGTNVPSMAIAHHFRTTRDELETSMERLASGRRINSADDDAAGAGIAARLTAQIRGTNMSIRNAQDGISAAQVAESALVEVENMTQRIRELAVQKATGTYNSNDTTNISAEITALNAEISRIASSTKFNTHTLSSMSFSFAISGTDTTVAMAFPAFLSSAGSTASAADTAINTIATARGKLGAYINRLEFTVNNLSNISANTEAALSRIQDADFAAESAKVAKGQVLQQAGAAMLSQANASTQYVLSLLQ